jgi:hypothetical protein
MWELGVQAARPWRVGLHRAGHQEENRREHAAHPPAFRAAVRQLLLGAHNAGAAGGGGGGAAAADSSGGSGSGAGGGGGGGPARCHLQRLPPSVLELIIREAAAPAALWARAEIDRNLTIAAAGAVAPPVISELARRLDARRADCPWQ